MCPLVISPYLPTSPYGVAKELAPLAGDQECLDQERVLPGGMSDSSPRLQASATRGFGNQSTASIPFDLRVGLE